MDDADRANDQADWMLDAAIRAARWIIDQPTATGYCLNCDAPIPPGRRWCGPECRDDWEFEQRRRPV